MLDEHGIDLLAGAGQDCDQAATTSAPIVFTNTSIHPAVNEDSVLRLRVGDNSVPSAQVTVTLYFAMGY